MELEPLALQLLVHEVKSVAVQVMNRVLRVESNGFAGTRNTTNTDAEPIKKLFTRVLLCLLSIAVPRHAMMGQCMTMCKHC